MSLSGQVALWVMSILKSSWFASIILLNSLWTVYKQTIIINAAEPVILPFCFTHFITTFSDITHNATWPMSDIIRGNVSNCTQLPLESQKALYCFPYKRVRWNWEMSRALIKNVSWKRRHLVKVFRMTVYLGYHLLWMFHLVGAVIVIPSWKFLNVLKCGDGSLDFPQTPVFSCENISECIPDQNPRSVFSSPIS